MGARIQIIVALVIVLALIIIIDMIRRKALELRYALAWLLVGFGVLILDLFPGIMERLSAFMGIELPINMLFFWGFCFSLVNIWLDDVYVTHVDTDKEPGAGAGAL